MKKYSIIDLEKFVNVYLVDNYDVWISCPKSIPAMYRLFHESRKESFPDKTFAKLCYDKLSIDISNYLDGVVEVFSIIDIMNNCKPNKNEYFDINEDIEEDPMDKHESIPKYNSIIEIASIIGIPTYAVRDLIDEEVLINDLEAKKKAGDRTKKAYITKESIVNFMESYGG